ncbi:hypothetical protein B0H14DRAFT_3445730 [Mycena olivaceomarginata]|nr:hypothetical protein B0H14DRAFT_3445730 [Mycena olivaceomarginata]
MPPQGIINVPHKGFIGIIIGDFNSQERSNRLKKAALDSLACQAEEVNRGKQPHHKSRMGKLLKPEEPTYTRLRDPDVAGIIVTIRGDHSLETVHVPIEHIRHLRQDDETLGGGPLFSVHYSNGMREPNHPPIHARSPIEAPSAVTPKQDQLLSDLQLPPRRMRRYGLGMGFAVAAPRSKARTQAYGFACQRLAFNGSTCK